jgi:DNA-binding MarR family transcriptional regulator
VARHKRGTAATRGAVSAGELNALVQFRYEIRRFLRFSEDAARAAGLEPQQYVLMLAIRGLTGEEPPTIGAIADQLQIQHHSAVELIDRSVTRGLVRRTRNDADRRQVMIELTAKGDRLLRDLAVHHRDQLSEAAPALVEALNTLMQSVESRGGASKSDAGGSVVLPRKRPPAKRQT